MKGIILHGGRGTRLRPLTHTGPKQLIPVANKPISQHVLESILQCEIEEVAMVLGNIFPEKVREHYGDGSEFGAKITYVAQGEPRGIAHAIGMCQEFTGDSPFVACLGDNLFKGGIKPFVKEFQTSNSEGMVILSEADDPQRFGVARFDEEGRFVGVVEKPKFPPSSYALTGVYLFKPTVFEMIRRLKPSSRNELEITEAIQLLIDNNYTVDHSFVEGWWKDTGTCEDILESNRLVLDEVEFQNSEIDMNSKIKGKMNTGLGCEISSEAVIKGPVVLGDKVEIGDAVYIGPYTSIGNSVTVRRGEIENSVVMDHCYIDIDDRITSSL
ncbi:MAG: glucose-1-phosphate thymidylyltransferase, partial [Candidatus Geothermarchaeales archaeon]